MAQKDILIAEDDEVLRNLYRKKFTMQGYAVREAKDGEEAVRMITEKQPDLLLVDVRMPKMDGLEVLAHFPKRGRKFAVIVVTNFSDEDLHEKVMENGADRWCIKRETTMKSLMEVTKGLLE
jgi:CheY-like chemotaxis protein